MLFSVVVINKISIAAPDDEPMYEESIFLVYASSRDEASAKAEVFAKQAETSYLNSDGETVTWSFQEVLSVYEISDQDRALVDGDEIYSRLFHDDEAHRRMRQS
ncbi:MAG TPA: DUF4288 domain-containing protein [Polyangia bacterium]|jgi:hypothetical protein|nr:DUF4288 domain-containing protein [Polyangia bacterium]